MFEYVLYAVAFIAVILAVEGAWRLVRANLGEERAVKRRLGRARATLAAAHAEPAKPDGLSAFLDARFPRLQRALVRAQAPFGAGPLLLGAGALFLLVLLGMSMIGAPRLLALFAAAALAGGAPYLIITGMTQRRRKRFLDQLPQAVDLMARSLQAGHPVANAMSVVGQRLTAPMGPEFQIVIDEMTYGLDRDQALDNLVRRFPVAELRMFTASLEVTRESGGNLAEVFLKLADAIRAKEHLRKKIIAISAEGRMTFWVVTALPMLVSAALMLVRPNFYLDVAKDPLFWPMISFAPVTLTIGAVIIWRMVNIRI